LRFVPPDFEVPEVLETGRFRLRTLTVNDLDKDFEAVMSSPQHLRQVWRNEWPDGLTQEQNLVDLGWHQKEFQRRSSFAYTVVAPDESRVLGCVYIYPSKKAGYDAEVYFWTRQDDPPGGFDEELGSTLKFWLASAWPFASVAFPGKAPDWEEWDAIKTQGAEE
jgi:hypothetical protein